MFEIDAVRDGDDLSLRLSGELDLGSVDRFKAALRLAETSDARVIVIDLTDLQFMDSTGLAVLLKAHTRSRANGQRLRFAPSKHDTIRQLVAITGTSEIFD
jgi:anti-sigma B factor antagonist